MELIVGLVSVIEAKLSTSHTVRISSRNIEALSAVEEFGECQNSNDVGHDRIKDTEHKNTLYACEYWIDNKTGKINHHVWLQQKPTHSRSPVPSSSETNPGGTGRMMPESHQPRFHDSQEHHGIACAMKLG